MNAITEPIAQEQCRCLALNDWFALYDDVARRRECPSTHHDALLSLADEMDRVGLIDWRECRDLKQLAGRGFLLAIAGGDYHAVGTGASSMDGGGA